MVEPFVNSLKKMGYHPEVALLDARYDSENNHIVLREQFGCINLICSNERRGKKHLRRNKSITIKKCSIKQL